MVVFHAKEYNMIRSKTCFKCKTVKLLNEFYKHNAMADGHLNKCKKCNKIDALEHRLKNIEKVREYDKRRAKLPDRVKLALRVNQEWRVADRRRAQCHNAVARAIRNNELSPMPCVRCGELKSLAHHEDYNKPLDVMWLCQPCHKQRHKEMALI
jgi:ribosomal protein S27AE